MYFVRETDDVYQALVADLANGAFPNAIMALTIMVIGTYVWVDTSMPAGLAAVAYGGVASIAKLGVVGFHRSRIAQGPLSLSEARRFEMAHSLTTFCVALSVGASAGVFFHEPDLTVKLLATGLIFGYCSGIVGRLSTRPRIAAMAVTIAALPGIVMCALSDIGALQVIACVFLIFFFGSMTSIAHAYRFAHDRISMQFQMANLARRDALTKLHNRLSLREFFESLPSLERRRIAVHAFDLDGFKLINDRLGHAAGDELLCILASRVQALCKGRDIAARFGGDEFVFVQAGLRDDGEARILAETIHSRLTQPCTVGAFDVTVGLSLGYCVATHDATTLDVLLQSADAASYEAKRQGVGVVQAAAADNDRPLVETRAMSSLCPVQQATG